MSFKKLYCYVLLKHGEWHCGVQWDVAGGRQSRKTVMPTSKSGWAWLYEQVRDLQHSLGGCVKLEDVGRNVPKCAKCGAVNCTCNCASGTCR